MQTKLLKDTFALAAKTDPTGLSDIFGAFIHNDCIGIENLNEE